MTRIDPRIKYNFYFNRSMFTDQPISWDGVSVIKFWNNIYDHFWNSGEMTLKKNVGEYSKDEIKKLFWDVFENMEEDNLIIDLDIINLHTLKFVCLQGKNTKNQSKSNLTKALVRLAVLFLIFWDSSTTIISGAHVVNHSYISRIRSVS